MPCFAPTNFAPRVVAPCVFFTSLWGERASQSTNLGGQLTLQAIWQGFSMTEKAQGFPSNSNIYCLAGTNNHLKPRLGCNEEVKVICRENWISKMFNEIIVNGISWDCGVFLNFMVIEMWDSHLTDYEYRIYNYYESILKLNYYLEACNHSIIFHWNNFRNLTSLFSFRNPFLCLRKCFMPPNSVLPV